jgi:hypothetical protein
MNFQQSIKQPRSSPVFSGGPNKLAADEKMDDDTGFSNPCR